MYNKRIIKNDKGFSPVFVLAVVIVFIISIFAVALMFIPQKPKCNVEDQETLEGFFRGFYKDGKFYNLKVLKTGISFVLLNLFLICAVVF